MHSILSAGTAADSQTYKIVVLRRLDLSMIGCYLPSDKDMAKKEQLLRKTFSEITEPLDPSLPIIVMDHQPGELSEASDAGVDLDLSGHTHDGQMFPANLVIHFLWENACGVLKKGAMTSIVTSGAGVWGPAMRVGTNNEVVIANVSFDPATDQ